MTAFVLLFAPMQSFSVLLPVVIHVGSVQDALNPFGVFNVPADGSAEAASKGDPGGPAEFILDFVVCSAYLRSWSKSLHQVNRISAECSVPDDYSQILGNTLSDQATEGDHAVCKKALAQQVGGLARNFPALCKALLPFVFGICPVPSSCLTVGVDLQFPFSNRIHGNILLFLQGYQ
jgi:hypothetical protein